MQDPILQTAVPHVDFNPHLIDPLRGPEHVLQDRTYLRIPIRLVDGDKPPSLIPAATGPGAIAVAVDLESGCRVVDIGYQHDVPAATLVGDVHWFIGREM